MEQMQLIQQLDKEDKKHRRWEDPDSGKTYSRDWQLVASGTRITAKFGTFFKELHRSQ
jgi:hypothetical protein